MSRAAHPVLGKREDASVEGGGGGSGAQRPKIEVCESVLAWRLAAVAERLHSRYSSKRRSHSDELRPWRH
jgi:hypothetical protein